MDLLVIELIRLVSGLLTSYAQRQPNASQESEMKRRAEQAECGRLLIHAAY